MKLHEMGYEEYGFSPGEEKKVIELCRKHDHETRTILHHAAYSTNEDIAEEMIASLTLGLSWEDIMLIHYIPMSKNMFYAYRRKCLATFRDSVAGS